MADDDKIETPVDEGIDIEEASVERTATATDAASPKNEGIRNKVMYQTTAALSRKKGYERHLRLCLMTVVAAWLFIFVTFRHRHRIIKSERLIGGIPIGYWYVFWPRLISLTVNAITISFWLIWVIIPLVLEDRRRFLLKKHLLYFIYGLKIHVCVVLYCALPLYAWNRYVSPLIIVRPAATESVVFFYDIFICLLVLSILWLIGDAFHLVLASSFCINSLFERAVESLAHDYIITSLPGSPDQPDEEEVGVGCISRTIKVVYRAIRGLFKESFARVYRTFRAPDDLPVEPEIDIDELMNVPADEFPLYVKQLIVDAVSGSVAWTFQKNGLRLMKDEQDVSRAASRIFSNLVKPGNSYIEVEDLKQHLPNVVLDLMLQTLEMDKNGRITPQSFRTWMVKAYEFRMVLKRSVAINKKLFKRLKMVTRGLLISIVILLWISLRKLPLWNIVVIIFAPITAGAFIFGDSIKKAFEGVVFLFAVHPFDVGDCCCIGGTPMVIEHMSILTTTVKKSDAQQIYYPNGILATLPISNYTRNPHMGDSLEFFVDIMTSDEQVEQLRNGIERYLENNKYHWKPEFSMVIKEIDGVDKMKMVLNLTHTINFRECPVRDERKFALIMALRKILKELNLKNGSG